MRIAIPVEKKSRDANIFEHFGRAPYYMFVDVKNGMVVGVEFVDNPSIEHSAGAIPEFLRNKKVDAIICRGIGRRAISYLQRYGIRVVSGAGGSAFRAVELFLNGELKSTEYTPATKWRKEI